jgi:hypothetical protein
MSPMRLTVPTINDQPTDFDKLFDLWAKAEDPGEDVELDFSGCRFLRQNAVCFLGGAIRHIVGAGHSVDIGWPSMREEILANLTQSGFAAAFGRPTPSWAGNSIPYREDWEMDPDGIVDYLGRQWLGRGWVSVSAPLLAAIVGKVWEIYENAFSHSESNAVFSCGQHYPTLKLLKLTVADFGVGIPGNVRRFYSASGRQGRPAAKDCLRWAFTAGTTTTPGAGSRGIGLELLKEFIRVNNGVLQVFSHGGYAAIRSSETYLDRGSFFPGTVVNITLRCDESLYRLASEVDAEPIF